MYLKLIGAILIVTGCGGVGFRIAASYKYEEKLLRQLCSILDFMESQMEYRLTALPQLCRQAAVGRCAPLERLFVMLSNELDSQVSPDAASCMRCAITKTAALPTSVKRHLIDLGNNLGMFDLDGQTKSIREVREHCLKNLHDLSQNKESRLRSYQTLGLCAGAALSILLI